MKQKRLQRGIIIAVVLLLLASLLACQLGRKQAAPEVVIVTPTPMAAAPTQSPEAPTQPPEAPTQPPEAPPPSSPPALAAGPIIDDFEGGDFEARWWSDVGEGTTSFTCALEQPGHDSAQAMRLTFEVGADGYAGCGIGIDPGQWKDAMGLSFSWRADQPGLAVIVGVGMEDPTQTSPDAGGITPFDAELTPGEEWTPVTLAWDGLTKPEWVGEGGVDTLDPTHIVAMNFYVIGGQSGSVWVDDLQLMVESSAAGVAAATPAIAPAAPPTAPETATPTLVLAAPPTAKPTPMPAAPPPAEGLPLNPNPPASTLKLIFVHHSTGGNWLADPAGNELGGDLGRALMDNNYFVSATNYGWEAAGDAIGDRTDIGNWWEWFRADNSANVLAALYTEDGQNFGDFGSWPRLAVAPPGENQVIMLKSCFPNSSLQGSPNDPVPAIGDNPLRGLDAWSEYHTVANAKGIYNDLLAYFATRQDKLFIVIAAPPLLDPTFADNARAFNIWLTQRWLAENGYSYRNVAVWDFYNVLTGPDNHHRYLDGAIEYITDQGGSTTSYPSEDEHPSRAGNHKATAEFVPWLNVIVHCWQEDGGCPSDVIPRAGFGNPARAEN